MDRLQSEAANLKALERLKPTPERWAIVRAALSSKWEGIQSAALRVLAAWGGEEAVHTLRRFLIEAFERKHGRGIRNAAADALARRAGPEDVDWILDLYFSRPTALEKHELLPLVLRLPVAEARGRLIRELGSADPSNRQAAVKAIGNMPFHDRETLLKPLRDDPEDAVAKSAKALTSRPLR